MIDRLLSRAVYALADQADRVTQGLYGLAVRLDPPHWIPEAPTSFTANPNAVVQEWRDSSGGVVVRMTGDGKITTVNGETAIFSPGPLNLTED